MKTHFKASILLGVLGLMLASCGKEAKSDLDAERKTHSNFVYRAVFVVGSAAAPGDPCVDSHGMCAMVVKELEPFAGPPVVNDFIETDFQYDPARGNHVSKIEVQDVCIARGITDPVAISNMIAAGDADFLVLAHDLTMTESDGIEETTFTIPQGLYALDNSIGSQGGYDLDLFIQVTPVVP